MIAYKKRLVKNFVTPALFFIYCTRNSKGKDFMCTCFLRRAIGIGALCFGAGVLLAFILPGLIVALLEAAVILLAGLMLCEKN